MEPVSSHASMQDTGTSQCRHCGGDIAPSDRAALGGFCCPGCRTVFHTIHELGLTEYYDLLRQQGEHPTRPSQETMSQFEYCNDSAFVERFTQRPDPQRSVRTVSLYLEGIHCAACVWLLEKLPLLNGGIVHARVEFGRSLVVIRYEPDATSLGAICSLVQSLGYVPVPINDENSTQKLKARSHRSMLLRIGIAAVCSMNIMMLSVSLYQGRLSGINPEHAALFSWGALLLSLPVVCYAAVPFYRTALGGLRGSVLHVDLPIALAIIAGFLFSMVNTVRGEYTLVYYDSVAALTLLLLGGRWLQTRSIERITDAASLLYALSPRTARLSGSESERFVESLEDDCVVEIRAGEIIPVDGIVVLGESVLIHQGILTGESVPVVLPVGAHAFAGTRVLSGTLKIRLTARGKDTRLGRILQSIEHQSLRRAPIELMLDRVSKGFTALVLMGAVGTFVFWAQYRGYEAAFASAVALLVVSCPCVLAVATPLTFGVALMQAARKGILIKSAEVIERLTHVRAIAFDKTGTLTEGNMAIAHALEVSEQSPSVWRPALWHTDPASTDTTSLSLFAIAWALERDSHHPIAVAVRAEAARIGIDRLPHVTVSQIRSIPGVGVAGIVDGMEWQLVAPRSNPALDSILVTPRVAAQNRAESEAVLVCAGVPRLWFSCSDTLRSDALPTIEKLSREDGYAVYLFSGDRNAIARSVGERVGIPPDHVRGELSPELKQLAVRDLETTTRVAMVGDGVNDAAALAAASVGIGVHGGAQVCLAVADVYLTAPGVARVAQVFVGAKRTLSVVRVSLWISAAYNILGAAGAVAGVIGPLHAAILMPISSISVILVALLSRKF